jgi:hypothetical protein
MAFLGYSAWHTWQQDISEESIVLLGDSLVAWIVDVGSHSIEEPLPDVSNGSRVPRLPCGIALMRARKACMPRDEHVAPPVEAEDVHGRRIWDIEAVINVLVVQLFEPLSALHSQGQLL